MWDLNEEAFAIVTVFLFALHHGHDLDDEAELKERRKDAADARHEPDLDGRHSSSWKAAIKKEESIVHFVPQE